MRGVINKQNVESMVAGQEDPWIWDTKLPGFGVVVTDTGNRMYKLKYRAGGRQRWLKLGQHSEAFTPELARRLAKKKAAEVANGGDPAATRDAITGAGTVDLLCERYLSDWAELHKKPRSIAEDRRNLALHIRPALGKLRVASVTEQDVLRLRDDMRATPIAANRVRALLSKMFNLAERWGLRPRGSNPCIGVERFRETHRERILEASEFQRISAALVKAEKAGEHPSAIAAIKLLMLTGMRREEALSLEWRFLDFRAGVARLPDSKTGAKVVPLGAPALKLLSELPRWNPNSAFVFPRTRAAKGDESGERDGHFIGLAKVWQRVRKAAGLADLRIHDLRHAWASAAVAGGQSLFIVGKALGHREARTTERYAHMATDPMVAAADTVAGAIAAMMEGKPKGELLGLKGRRTR